MTKYLNELVTELESIQGDNCVTIYLPLNPGKTGSMKNSNKLDVLLRQAVEYLEQGGMRNKLIHEFLKPVDDFAKDGIIANEAQQSMIICLTEGFLKFAQLPFLITESISISKNFDLKALKDSYIKNSEFYLLSISQNQVKFYECDEFHIIELSLKNLPTNLHEVVGKKTIEKQSQIHTISSGASTGMHHGHTGDTDFTKNNLEKYLRGINEIISEYLKQHNEPLVLATVETTYAKYKDINSYKKLLSNFVSLSPDRITEKELHEKAWEIVKDSILALRIS